MFLSDVSSVKILGRSLRAARRVKPSDFDGDGDGFLTGPDGRDDVPAPDVDVARSGLPSGSAVPSGGVKPSDGSKPRLRVVDGPKKRHAGSRFLDLIDTHTKAMEEKFGDLRDADNVRRAVKQTFPNVQNFDWLDDNQTTLDEFEHARIVALLHLGQQDKDVAKTLLDIGWLSPADAVDTNAAVTVGLLESNGRMFFTQKLEWDKNLKGPPARVLTERVLASSGGWGDLVAAQMVKDGASPEEVSRFWITYIMNHEWTHIEHRKAGFDKMGLPFDRDPVPLMRAVAKANGVTGAQYDALLSQAKAQRKLMEPNESAEDFKIAIGNFMVNQFSGQLGVLMEQGSIDDLTPIELRQLGPNYSRSVTPYAAVNFKELVAEKASAARFNYDLGVNNPPWRKFNAWLYKNTAKPAIDTTGMSRQERRAAERAAAKKKDAQESGYSARDFEPRFEIIFNSCTGFPHHKGKSKGKKPVIKLNIKALDFFR